MGDKLNQSAKQQLPGRACVMPGGMVIQGGSQIITSLCSIPVTLLLNNHAQIWISQLEKDADLGEDSDASYRQLQSSILRPTVTSKEAVIPQTRDRKAAKPALPHAVYPTKS